MSRPALLPLIALLPACSGLFGKGAESDAIEDCVVHRSDLAYDELSEIGFSGAQLAPLAEGEHTAPFLYSDEGGETVLHLGITADTSGARFVDSSPVEDGSGAMELADGGCNDSLEVNATFAFLTEDGAFDETWSGTLSSEDGVVASLYAAIDPDAINGSFDMEALLGDEDWDSVTLSLQGAAQDGSTSGQLSGSATKSEDCEEGEECMSFGRILEIGSWNQSSGGDTGGGETGETG